MPKREYGLMASLTALTLAASCAGGKGIPKGPPPEYEADPLPAWMRDAGPAAPAVSSAPASSSTPLPVPPG